MILPTLPMKTRFRKPVALLVALSFTLSNIAFADIPKTNISDTKKQAEITADPEKVVVPRDYGLIKSRYTAKDSKKLIIHIQDAHCNYEAQSNIIKILECLIKNDGLGLISVEGADGFIDTSWFKAFPDADIRKEVADYFMKKGEITGPEFLSITADYPIKLFGAETRSYYIENLNAFTSSYPLKEDTEKYFNQIKAVLNKLKITIYNEELKTFDAKSQDYEAKKISFTDYVKYLENLAAQHKIGLRQYDNLFKLISVLIYEKKINFNVVDKERAALIDAVTKKLDKDQLAELVNKSLEFKSGKIASTEYYDYLKALASKYGILLANDYPNLFNYIIYNSVYSRIENEKLFNDIKKFEEAIKDKLFANDEQRTLDKLSRHINILLGLVNIRLLNGDFDYYKERKEEFAHELFADFINKMAARYGFAYEIDPPSEAVRESMLKLEDFYAIAVKRDKALVDNTIQAMGKESAQVSVLVTGGFHSEGITKLLEKQGISYVVVCPNITKEVETPYIKILTNQRTPLEEILSDTGVTTADAKNVKNGMLAPYLMTAAIAARINEDMLPKLLQERADKDLAEWAERYVKLWLPKARQDAANKKLEVTPKLCTVLFGIDVDKNVERYIEVGAKDRNLLSMTAINHLKQNAARVKELAAEYIGRILAGTQQKGPGPRAGNFIGRIKTSDGCIIKDVKGSLSKDNDVLTLSSKEWGIQFNLKITGKASPEIAAENIRKIKEAVAKPSHALIDEHKDYANEIIKLLESRVSAKGGKIYLLEENKEGVLGFSDSSNIFIAEPLANEYIAWFHEGGEAYFTDLEKFSKLETEGLNPHTYLRGVGYKTRLKAGSVPLNHFTPVESSLIRVNKGLGLQDMVFGEHKNNQLSRKIAAILKKETAKALDFTTAILTDEQLKLIENAAVIYGLGEIDKMYLTQMWAQYLAGQTNQVDLRPLKNSLKIMKDPSGINDKNYNPEKDGNFILTSMFPQDVEEVLRGRVTPPHTFKYHELTRDKTNAEAAKENVTIAINSLDAGLGENLKRQLFKAKQFNAPLEQVVLGAKGTDLGYHLTYNKQNVFVSIAEAKLLQLALAASEKKFSAIELQPIVNTDSRGCYEKLLDETICLYDRFNDSKIQKRTYRQLLNENGITDIKMVNVPSLPGISTSGSLAFATKGQPGGHGQLAFFFLYDAYHTPLPSDNKTHIRVFYNGDSINSRINEYIAGKMARSRLPIVKLTTPATPIDKKGGKDGDRVLKVGRKILRIPDQMEEADAKAAEKHDKGQLEMFYESGQGGRYGAVGSQPFNTNIFYINLTQLHPILRELVDSKAISQEQLYDIISPILIEKGKKLDRNNQPYVPIDGAIGTAIHNLNAFFMTHMDDPRIRSILDKRGIDHILYFVEVPRTEFFTPVKYPYDIWLQDYSDYYTQIDVKEWILHDSRGVTTPPRFDLECLGPDKKETYWDELQNIIDSFGKAEVRELKSITIRGKVLLKNARLAGDITIKNESDRLVDLNSEKEFEGLKGDDRLLLDNAVILINKKGKVTIDKNNPVNDAGAIRLKGGTISAEDHGTRTMKLRTELKNRGYDENYYKFPLSLKESQETFAKIRENNLNGALERLIEEGKAYAIIKNDVILPGDTLIEVTKDKTDKTMQQLQSELARNVRGTSFIVVKGLKAELRTTGLTHITDIGFHYGVTREAVYIDEEDFNYLFSLPDGVDIIMEGAIHERAHIDNELKYFENPVKNPFLTEEEIEEIAPSTRVREAMHRREKGEKVGNTFKDAQVIGQKLHTPLAAADNKIAALFLQGGYNQPGYGVPAGAAIDGSFAIGNEGNQGYYVNGGKDTFLLTVQDMKKFFRRREAILGEKIKYVIKPGIGGQHTPFQGIASAFEVVDMQTGKIAGEYELGKDYEASLAGVLKKSGADWRQVVVIPSSKSGSTDETMMIFTEIFYIMLKNIAAREGLNGEFFANTVLNTMHEVNFVQGKERPAKDLFKGFNISLVQKNLQSAGLAVTLDQVKNIFDVVLGNMFFETTDRPDQSRLSAFIRNSGLDKELGENAPGFGAMFDNVGGRWTADLHMMTFLAFHKLNAEEYWNTRYEGIKKVREGVHKANTLADKIINEGITDIAFIMPDELFWFGKAMEQNFNESIWQNGFANLVAIKASEWETQKSHYDGKASRLVINISNTAVPEHSFNVMNLGGFKLKGQGGQGIDKQELANSLGELFTTFYGMTHTVGNMLIARALAERGYTAANADLNDLNNPATKIVQQNLYVRQPYVELGKGLLEKKLKALQEEGPRAIEEELNRIKEEARKQQIVSNVSELKLPAKISNIEELASVIDKAVKFAQDSNRKFVPFIYLEGEKFIALREYLVGLGIEWVMQGTGDQHISYQQVLAQPKKYLPFVISFVPEKTLPGRPAIGFAKGYLHDVSPSMIRDFFAEASYKALTEPRKNEAGEEVKGAAGIFMRIIDSEKNREMLAQSFETAVRPEPAPEDIRPAASEKMPDVEEPKATFDHTVASIMLSSEAGERARRTAETIFKEEGKGLAAMHLIFVKSAIPENQLVSTTAINFANVCKDHYTGLEGYTADIVDNYEEAVNLLAKNPDWNKNNTIVGLIDAKQLDDMSTALTGNNMKDKTKLLAMEKFSEDQFVPLKGFFDLMAALVRINKPLDKESDRELLDAIRDLLNEIGIKDINRLVDALSSGDYFEDPIKFAKNFILRLLPPAKPRDVKELKLLYDAAKKVVESL